LRLEFFAELVLALPLCSLEDAEALRGQHVWRDEIIAERFDWGREKAIFALAVRVFRLPQPVELPLLASYGGCKSWVELATEVSMEGAEPVLAQTEFDHELQRLKQALQRNGKVSCNFNLEKTRP
jgi:hypothetical protein